MTAEARSTTGPILTVDAYRRDPVSVVAEVDRVTLQVVGEGEQHTFKEDVHGWALVAVSRPADGVRWGSSPAIAPRVADDGLSLLLDELLAHAQAARRGRRR